MTRLYKLTQSKPIVIAILLSARKPVLPPIFAMFQIGAICADNNEVPTVLQSYSEGGQNITQVLTRHLWFLLFN
jgi:hypothetical protein